MSSLILISNTVIIYLQHRQNEKEKNRDKKYSFKKKSWICFWSTPTIKLGHSVILFLKALTYMTSPVFVKLDIIYFSFKEFIL